MVALTLFCKPDFRMAYVEESRNKTMVQIFYYGNICCDNPFSVVLKKTICRPSAIEAHEPNPFPPGTSLRQQWLVC